MVHMLTIDVALLEVHQRMIFCLVILVMEVYCFVKMLEKIKIKKTELILIVLTILLVQTIAAQEIILDKTISKTEVHPNEWFLINLKITNQGKDDIVVNIHEPQPEAFDFRDYTPFVQPYTHLDGTVYVPPYIDIKRSVPANSFIEEKFVAKVDEVGNFYIAETIVNTISGIYSSNSLKLRVLCNLNNQCELNLDENYETCPEDCPSGSEDRICDMKKDNILDPDCILGADPDYIAPHCFNGKKDEGELSIDCGYECKWDCKKGLRPEPSYDKAPDSVLISPPEPTSPESETPPEIPAPTPTPTPSRGGGGGGGGSSRPEPEVIEEICTEDWICDIWKPEICPESEIQTRICGDWNKCGTTDFKPTTVKTCTYIAPVEQPPIVEEPAEIIPPEEEKVPFLFIAIVIAIIITIISMIVIYELRKPKSPDYSQQHL